MSKMDARALNNWLQLGASVGVIIGLFLIVVELRQGELAMEADLRDEYFNSLLETRRTLLGENPLVVWEKACLSPDELSLQEHLILDAFFEITIFQILRIKLRADEIQPNYNWQSLATLEFIKMFQLSHGIAYFQATRNEWSRIDSEFVEFTDSALLSTQSRSQRCEDSESEIDFWIP